MQANRTQGGIRREFFRYALPAVLGMVASSLYTVVDGIFVGRGVGAVALAAVNIVYPFIMLQIALTMLVAIGGANLFSNSRGRDDLQEATSLFNGSVLLLFVVALLVNGAGLACGEFLCRLMGADDTLLPMATEYLKWMAVFGIAYMPGLGISIFVRNDGAPRLEMAGTLAGAAVNIGLDYLFIMVYGWGIAGAAVASGIGQMVSVAVYMTHFLKKSRVLRFARPMLVRAGYHSLLRSGLPSFLMEFSQSAITISFNIVLIHRMGTMGVAAYSVVMYICSLFNMVLIGVVQGAQPLMSYHHGRGEDAKVRQAYAIGVRANLVITLVCYALIYVGGERLAGIFMAENAGVSQMAVEMMRVYFLGFFPIGVTLMNILLFQTTGRAAKASGISALRCVGFVQVFLLVLPPMLGAMGIYLSLLCGELCNCAVSLMLYKREEQVLRAGMLQRAVKNAR